MRGTKMGVMVALAWTAVSSNTALAGTQTFSVVGGGTLTATLTSTSQRCVRTNRFETLDRYTNFSYTLDTITNPSAIAILDVEDVNPCVPTVNATLQLSSGCNIVFDPDGPLVAVLNCPGTAGYAGPKYVVVGVTYVPPGPGSSVQYSATQSFGTTSSLSNSFASNVSSSISVSASIAGILNGSVSVSASSSATQTMTNSSSVTLNLQSVYTNLIMGTQDAFDPVDHDFDIIWLWLNPLQVFTMFPHLPGTPPVVTWNGYAFDASDQPAMDIWPIEVGYLNGHFGALPFTDAVVLGRSWAANQIFAPGDGPGLTNTDFANILRADSFASGTYQVTLAAGAPATTTDGRFTIAGGVGSPQSFVYRQPAPGSLPSTQTLSTSYSRASSLGQSATYQSETSYSVSASLSPAFLSFLTVNLKKSWTFTTTQQSSSTTTNTQAQMATLSITGPSCGSNTAPCSPVYTGPAEFDVYQDNIFGTFMFNPVH